MKQEISGASNYYFTFKPTVVVQLKLAYAFVQN